MPNDMTLLDWFAGQALEGMCAHGVRDQDIPFTVKAAYDIAQKMLAEKARVEGLGV